MAISKAVEVIIVANAVSIGITKFSGFKPLLKVIIETPKDKITMPMKANMLDNQITNMKSSTLDERNTWLITRDIKAKTVNIKNEATTRFQCFFHDSLSK